MRHLLHGLAVVSLALVSGVTFCMFESSHLTTYSALPGSCASTSDLSRRSRKGRSTWCSRLMTSRLSSSVMARSSTVPLDGPALASGAENHCATYMSPE